MKNDQKLEEDHNSPCESSAASSLCTTDLLVRIAFQHQVVEGFDTVDKVAGHHALEAHQYIVGRTHDYTEA